MKNKTEVEIHGMGKIIFEKLKDENKNSRNNPIKNSKYLKTVSYEEFRKMLGNEYILSLLKKRDKIRIFKTAPINLISKYRYDVFVKYYYVQSYIKNENYNLAKEIYLNHIKSFNNFVEPDGRKDNSEDFIKGFNELIENVKNIGIEKTIIPITKNGEIIDGAHRLAIALYLNLKIQFAIFNLLDANYGKEFFISRGFNKKYIKIIDKEVVNKLKWRKRIIQKFLLFYVV